MERCLQTTAPRIYLRPLNPADAKNFALLLGGDPKSISMMNRMPHPCTRRSARDWIEDHSAPECSTFGIVRRSDRNFLGAIGLNREAKIPELGYWVGRPYWSLGYATEAVKIIETLAADLGLTCLAAETYLGNRASQRVLAKAGFQEAGLFDRESTSGAQRDVICRYEKPLSAKVWT